MATNNVLNNSSIPFTVASGNLGITTGSLVLPAYPNSSIICGATTWFNNAGSSTDSNIFLGENSGNPSNITSKAVLNVALGKNALSSYLANSSSATGGNTAIGARALEAFKGSFASGGLSSHNTCIGFQAGVALLGDTGDAHDNTLIGVYTGANYADNESNNIAINHYGISGDTNTIRIGSMNTTYFPTAITNCYIAGISGVTVTGSAVLCSTTGALGTISSSIRSKENIEDMGIVSEDIYKLRPVTFNYIKNPEMGRQVGLIAEEVNEIMPNLVIIGLDGLPETVKYHELPAMLLNEIQKLHKRITELEAELEK